MNQPNLNQAIHEQLAAFEHANPFVQANILSSKVLYPNSKGEGLPILNLKTRNMEAHISLQGAQLLKFKPANGDDFLWLSPNCDFTRGTALRGGIPLCLPWFGPHPTDAKKGKHGFTRNREWQLKNISTTANESTEVIFEFNHSGDELFEQSFSAQLKFILKTDVQMELSVKNLTSQTMPCSFAFHTYFPVKDLNDVKVIGLAQRDYLDNLEQHKKKFQENDVQFHGEVDRVFPGINNSVELLAASHFKIEHQNCPSVIVWNCGAANAQKIADIGEGNELHYVCVECGAVLAEQLLIKGGEQIVSQMKISRC